MPQDQNELASILFPNLTEHYFFFFPVGNETYYWLVYIFSSPGHPSFSLVHGLIKWIKLDFENYLSFFWWSSNFYACKAIHLNKNVTSFERRTLMWIHIGAVWCNSSAWIPFNIIYWEKVLKLSKSIHYYLKYSGTLALIFPKVTCTLYTEGER